MENRDQINSEAMQIQGLLDRYLHFRSSNINSENHLDDDSLSSFVEGRLNPREAKPILKHLTDCSFCLNITAELAMLETQFEKAPVTFAAAETEPAKVSDVLKGILSRIFGSAEENVVFAHEEKQTNENAETESEKDLKE